MTEVTEPGSLCAYAGSPADVGNRPSVGTVADGGTVAAAGGVGAAAPSVGMGDHPGPNGVAPGADEFAVYRRAALYDAQHADHTDDLPFLLEFVCSGNGDVLEVASGTGRIACRLAQEGLAVTGIDIVPEMVEFAQARSRANRGCSTDASEEGGFVDGHTQGGVARFVCADMRSFDLGRSFSRIILGFNSIGHLADREDLRSFLDAAYRALVPGGRLCIAAHRPNPAYFERTSDVAYPVHSFAFGDGEVEVEVVEHLSYLGEDDLGYRTHHKWFAIGDDWDDCFDFRLRWFKPEEVVKELTNAGFRLVAQYGEYDKRPPDAGYEAIYIAERPVLVTDDPARWVPGLRS